MGQNQARLFFSYSHKDEDLRSALETHLAMLRREGLILPWHDRRITAGQSWNSEIDKNINEADIIILLISPDFINSDYCYGKELMRALERHESGEAHVLPIISRPVDWTRAPFSKLQALPKDGIPVTTWTNRDEAWLDVARGVRNTVEHVLAKRATATTIEPFNLSDLLKEEFSRIESLYDRKNGIGGASTGFYELDHIIDGIHRKDIVLIAGRPLMGKSDLALNIAKVALEEFTPVVFFSMRLTPEQIIRRLLAFESKVSNHRFSRGFFGERDWTKITHAAKILSDSPFFIYWSPGFTNVDLAERVSKFKKARGLGLVVVDGVEHLTSTYKFSSRKAEVETIVKAIRKISGDHSVPIILTANTSDKGDMRDDNRPKIEDLEEWNILATDAANVVLFLYKSENYWIDSPERGIAEVIVAKNNDGPKATIKLAYLPEYCSFVNVDESDNEMSS